MIDVMVQNYGGFGKMYVTKRTANCHKVEHKGFSKVYFSNRIEAIAQFWRDYNKENIK